MHDEQSRRNFIRTAGVALGAAPALVPALGATHPPVIEVYGQLPGGPLTAGIAAEHLAHDAGLWLLWDEDAGRFAPAARVLRLAPDKAIQRPAHVGALPGALLAVWRDALRVLA